MQELHETLLGGQGNSVFANNMENLESRIFSELPNISEQNIPNNLVNEAISMNVDAMKITPTFIAERQGAVNTTSASINHGISLLPVDMKTQDYIRTFPKRMAENRQLFENPDEEKMYQSVIQNTNMMNVGGMQIKIGNYFAALLDDMVQQKTENSFLSKFAKGDKTGYNWTI